MEITLKELSEEFDMTLSHLAQLIRRGVLPPGRKDGLHRYMPAVECKLILASHKPGEHWVTGRARPGKRTKTKKLTWKDLL